MAFWEDNHVVVFRANSVRDPEAEGYIEQAVAVTFLTPNTIGIGDAITDGLGRLEGVLKARRKTEMTCLGFIRDYETEDDEQFQHVAFGQRLIERLLLNPTVTGEWHVCIYKTYNLGSSPELGPIPRAVIDETTGEVVEDMAYWAHVDDDPNGTLPRWVVLDGDAELEPRGDGTALYDLTVTLLDEDPL